MTSRQEGLGFSIWSAGKMLKFRRSLHLHPLLVFTDFNKHFPALVSSVTQKQRDISEMVLPGVISVKDKDSVTRSLSQTSLRAMLGVKYKRRDVKSTRKYRL